MAIFTAAALAKAGTALSIGSSVAGIFGGLKGNEEARKLARQQAFATFRQRMEETRRAERDWKRVIGTNRAAIGASNVQFSGSARRVLNDVQSDFANDVSWRAYSAENEKRSIMANAPGRGSDIATVLQGASSIGSSLLNHYGR